MQFPYFCNERLMKKIAKKGVGKKTILNITPQTFVRTTVGDRWFFRIPRENLRPAGLKRLLRIERYNEYKLSLSAEAKRVKFTMPPSGAAIVFYIPCPRTWSKKKKKQYHGMLHQSTPDLDNLTKAMMDSLLAEDKYIANYSLTKRWVDFEQGWIEITIQDEPAQVLIMPPAKE